MESEGRATMAKRKALAGALDPCEEAVGMAGGAMAAFLKLLVRIIRDDVGKSWKRKNRVPWYNININVSIDGEGGCHGKDRD